MTVPIGFGALTCFILPTQLLKAEGQGLFNMYLEFLIRRSPSKLIGFLRDSKVAATIIFSVLHSCIMFGFLKKSSKCFWFSSFKIRETAPSEKEDKKCERIHGKLTCATYLSQVIKKTFSCELTTATLTFGIVTESIYLFSLLTNRNWSRRQNLRLDLPSLNFCRQFSFCVTNRRRFQSCSWRSLITVWWCFAWASTGSLRWGFAMTLDDSFWLIEFTFSIFSVGLIAQRTIQSSKTVQFHLCYQAWGIFSTPGLSSSRWQSPTQLSRFTIACNIT